MADSYYLRYRGRTVGPYTLKQSQDMARKGQLSRTSEVSTDGQSWSQASSFAEIFEPPASSRAIATRGSDSLLTTAPVGRSVAPPATAGSSEWYYASGTDQQGPTSAANIIGWIKAGSLTASDRVWRDGLDSWVAISDVPEFNAAIGPVAPQPRPTGGGGGAGAGVGGGAAAFCRECGASINRRAVICTQCGVPTEAGSDPLEVAGRGLASVGTGRQHSGPPKSKQVAAVLALFLGGLGGHHFYLGNIVLGVIYLLFCMTLIPSLIAFIEAIVFLTMSDEAFNAKYNA